MKQKFINEELEIEFSTLKSRASEIGYKNGFPQFPRPQHSKEQFNNLMIGFNKRLANWKNGLSQMENPGGTLNGKKRFQTEKTLTSDDFSGNFVIKNILNLSI